ncbi:pyridoxamine 5'-phosphate oxidase family protein [Peptoniphilus raoultii]|nr:pyridoxamine 5'-phosphate oxidase family protein [Peptoniphilus raoultii]
MKLNDEMKKIIKDKLAYIATVGEDGLPDIGPKKQ